MALLILFSFISGVVTILAPCIWPVLPIVLSSSLAGNSKKRALGITLGIIISFATLTLSISTLVRILHLDPNLLRLIAVFVIFVLGLSMIFPALYTWFELLVSKLGNIFGNQNKKADTDFLSSFVTGLSLGIVWSPCAGPILATIATLSSTGRVNFDVVLITISYVIGVGVPLFAFAYGGQWFVLKTKWLSPYTEKIQRMFGVVMILSAIAIFTNYDQTLQLKLLNTFPALSTTVNGFENSNLVVNQLAKLKGGTPSQKTVDDLTLLNANMVAPEFKGITNWINTDKELSIKNLKGKVVLVDFWTYTCINCLRTLPHITALYEKYKDSGFVVVGIHTPEFQFEHDNSNVSSAVKMLGIKYPVGQDNNYETWNNYENLYWPAEYLIDAEGNIRRTSFGEGEYDKTEQAVQILLKENGHDINMPNLDIPDQTPKNRISPETYFGTNRMQYYYPNGTIRTGIQAFVMNNDIPENSFTYGGQWDVQPEYSTSIKDSTLNYNFTANKVYAIFRPAKIGNSKVEIYIDGKIVNDNNAGSDIKNGILTVSSDKLYNIIDLHGKNENHTLLLKFLTPQIQIYTFTFG